MKIGDLICYNAAGQRSKTLGLILDIDTKIDDFYATTEVVLIQWCMIGELLPRQISHIHSIWRVDSWKKITENGMLGWYKKAHYLEVVQ